MTATDPPKFIAYAIKRDRHNVRWVEIGVASAHADDKGFNVYLDRLPIGGFNGHILVRAKDAPQEEPEAPVLPRGA